MSLIEIVSIPPFFSLSFLLCFLRSRQSLKVREHKVLGPYVDGLSQLAVTSFEVCVSPFCHRTATRDEAEPTPVSLTNAPHVSHTHRLDL